MSTELKDCPFCGAAAEWSHHSDYTHGYGDEPRRVYRWQSSLRCTGCRLPHCSGFGEVKWEGGNGLAQQYAMRRALEQWNRRALEAAPPATPEARGVWPDYIAGMIETYLRSDPAPDKREGAIAGIIRRRIWSAAPPATPVASREAPSDALTPEQRRILAFLWGTGEIDGYGYGDQHPGERGRYWWRKHLLTAFPSINE